MRNLRTCRTPSEIITMVTQTARRLSISKEDGYIYRNETEYGKWAEPLADAERRNVLFNEAKQLKLYPLVRVRNEWCFEMKKPREITIRDTRERSITDTNRLADPTPEQRHALLYGRAGLAIADDVAELGWVSSVIEDSDNEGDNDGLDGDPLADDDDNYFEDIVSHLLL